MGDTAIDFFLDTLKQLITSSKLNSIIEEKHQLQSLEAEIKYLREFLKITEKKRNEHSELMKLVMEIRKVVSDAKNIVEQFVIDATRKTKRRTTMVDDLSLDLESVKKVIKTIMAEVKHISDENIYDINGVAMEKHKHSSTRNGGGSSLAGGNNTSKVVKEKVVVGFDKEVERLIQMLDDRGEGRPLEIIKIIGPGGGGKTTLAREVYDHPFTSYIFEIRAWVDVSQDYNKTTTKRDLLIRVLKSTFPENQEDYENSSEDMLGEKVLRYLKGKKYLIVMDDIWDVEAWNDIQRSYPNECNGSKVLFTSRQLLQLDNVRFVPYYLQPLPNHQSWELLQKKVFGMNCCPPELADIGMKIAEKCEGLPLAIVAIAGILATEDKTLNVWQKVAQHLSSIIAKNKEAGCMEILELSYNHLPLQLKVCFLYIGAFLEDSDIRVRKLLWLWIAEGFIQQSEGGKTLEDIAKGHLVDLVDRSLVMVARKSSLGGIKTCRIHNLLRVFCLKKAEENNFLVQIYKDDSFSPSTTNNDRCLFISSQFFDKFPLGPRAQNLHSIVCLPSPSSKDLSFEHMSFFSRNFERFRVLSFISAKCEPRIRTGHLVNLKYLATRITSSSSSRFFASVSNLLNLETLELEVEKTSESIQLPCDIFKMVKLRHLYSKKGVFQYHFSSEEAARVGFDHSSKLDSLQTLHKICDCKDCQSFLVRTPNLKKLGLAAKYERMDVMLPDLEFLKCLETLTFDFVTLAPGLKLPPTLKRLTLSKTSLKWEELSIIQNLPSLEVLKLIFDACDGRVWNTSEEGFSKLKYLSLSYMSEIEEWNASEDQFPRLEVLALDFCLGLQGIPIDFANLNELRKIQLFACTPSVEESARNIQKEQREKKGDDDCPNLIVTPFSSWVVGRLKELEELISKIAGSQQKAVGERLKKIASLFTSLKNITLTTIG